jgi:hypothetical protein
MLESKVEYSDKFAEILKSVSSPIAKDLLSLRGQEKDIRQNYIDVDFSNPREEEITFILDNRARNLLTEFESVFIMTDPGKHLKSSEFKSEGAEKQNLRIYELLGLSPSDVKKAKTGDKVKIIKEVASSKGTKTYVLYEGITDNTLKGVINKEAIKQSDEGISKVWSISRNPMKIGRWARSILPLTGKKYTDAEIEKFVNDYLSTLGIMKDAFSKFDIVSGKQLLHFYNMKRYEDPRHTLGNSCMANVPDSTLEIYWSNPDKVQLVILYSDKGSIKDGKYQSDKIVGRALLWETDQGFQFLDRIYTNRDADVELFKKYAEFKGWFYKMRQESSYNFNIQSGNTTKQTPKISVTIKNKTIKYPYMDSLRFYNSSTGVLSNRKDEGVDRILINTGGGYEDADDY